MKLWTLIGFTALLSFLLILCWAAIRGVSYADNIRKSRFKERSPIDDEHFFDLYYRDSALQRSVVIALRHELESAFLIPRQVLLPTDRFSSELSVIRGWEYLDDSRNEIFLLNREREKSLGVQIPLKELHTVDDYIRIIAPLLSQKQTGA